MWREKKKKRSGALLFSPLCRPPWWSPSARPTTAPLRSPLVWRGAGPVLTSCGRISERERDRRGQQVQWVTLIEMADTKKEGSFYFQNVPMYGFCNNSYTEEDASLCLDLNRRVSVLLWRTCTGSSDQCTGFFRCPAAADLVDEKINQLGGVVTWLIRRSRPVVSRFWLWISPRRHVWSKMPRKMCLGQLVPVQSKRGVFLFQLAHYLSLLIFHEDKTQTSAHINFSSPSAHITRRPFPNSRGERRAPCRQPSVPAAWRSCTAWSEKSTGQSRGPKYSTAGQEMLQPVVDLPFSCDLILIGADIIPKKQGISLI